MNIIIAVLLAGVLVGQAGIAIPAPMQWTFFLLFLFSVGYMVLQANGLGSSSRFDP